MAMFGFLVDVHVHALMKDRALDPVAQKALSDEVTQLTGFEAEWTERLEKTWKERLRGQETGKNELEKRIMQRNMEVVNNIYNAHVCYFDLRDMLSIMLRRLSETGPNWREEANLSPSVMMKMKECLLQLLGHTKYIVKQIDLERKQRAEVTKEYQEELASGIKRKRPCPAPANESLPFTPKKPAVPLPSFFGMPLFGTTASFDAYAAAATSSDFSNIPIPYFSDEEIYSYFSGKSPMVPPRL